MLVGASGCVHGRFVVRYALDYRRPRQVNQNGFMAAMLRRPALVLFVDEGMMVAGDSAGMKWR
jgi:hypothetical protein